MRAVALALAGVASASGGSVVFLGAYPGYAGNLSVTGTLKVSSTAGGIALEGIVAGLEPSATGGMHVHAGFTCDDAESVGGHYYDGLAADPWGANTTYDSDGAGVAFPSMAVAAFSLSGPTRPVDGRAVVVHAADGTRVACGLLTPTSGEFAELGAYPGSSNGTASGLVLVEDSPTGVALRGTLAGLAPGTGGFHVHGGYTCDDAAGVFGHYYEGADDPWAATTATADASGAATVALDVAGYSLRGVMPVAYRALVAHDSEGTRVGCGVLGTAPLAVATLGAYPGLPTPRPTSSPTRKSKMHVSSSKRAGLNFAGILLIAAFALGPITFGVLCYPAKPRGGPGSLFQKGFTWDGDKAKDPDRWSERL